MRDVVVDHATEQGYVDLGICLVSCDQGIHAGLYLYLLGYVRFHIIAPGGRHILDGPQCLRYVIELAGYIAILVRQYAVGDADAVEAALTAHHLSGLG